MVVECLLGIVSPVNSQLIGILMRNDDAGYLLYSATAAKKTASIYFGAIRRQRFTLLVFTLGGPLTVPRIWDTPLTYVSQDETLIHFASF